MEHIMSNKQRVLNVLLSGQTLTAKQIASRFGVANPTALVSSLRMTGYPIYLNEGTKDERGRVRASKYRLGTASKEVIAAGYRARAMGL
jgi:predicted ArsR family transcriptional regulator